MNAAELLRQAGRIVQEAGARLEDPEPGVACARQRPHRLCHGGGYRSAGANPRPAAGAGWDHPVHGRGKKTTPPSTQPARSGILDPVDGTTNLIHGFRHSAISLALAEGGRGAPRPCVRPLCGGNCFLPGGAGERSATAGPSGSAGLRVWRTASARWGPIPAGGRKPPPPLPGPAASTTGCHDIRRLGAASVELCYTACGRLRCVPGARAQTLGLCGRLADPGRSRRPPDRMGRHTHFPLCCQLCYTGDKRPHS